MGNPFKAPKAPAPDPELELKLKQEREAAEAEAAASALEEKQMESKKEEDLLVLDLYLVERVAEVILIQQNHKEILWQ